MKHILERLFRGEFLTVEESRNLLAGIGRKEYPAAQVAALMTVYRMRPITVDEMVGYRSALIDAAVKVDLSEYGATEIVGTGGDGKNTFNISTCSAFVVAGAGYKVAKHGNVGSSSVSGASNVLMQHGVKFTSDESRLRESIEKSGVAYMHAPLFHPALAAVGPIRKEIGFKTFFNLLGPLTNPSGPSYQLLGVADLSQLRLYTAVLQRLGIGFSIVTSLDGYDEISLTSDFKVSCNATESIYSPEGFGFERSEPGSLSGGATPEEASKIFDAVLEGRATAPQRNAVIAGAAFAIRNFVPERSVEDCIAAAAESLDSGRALGCFRKFVEING